MNPIKDIQKKKYAYSYRSMKIVEFLLLFILLLIYLIVFCVAPEHRDHLKNSTSFLIINIAFVCTLTYGLLCSILDLTKYSVILKQYEEGLANSYLDNLTGIPNRTSCDLVFDMYGNNQSLDKVACAVIRISNLAKINDDKGRNAGNQALVDFSWILEDLSENIGFVGRNGGNEFLLIIDNCDDAKMNDFFEKLDLRMRGYNQQTDKDSIEYKYEYVLNKDLKATKFSEIISEAYKKLNFVQKRR